MAFLKMAFCKLHNDYWAVNLASLDNLSNKETSILTEREAIRRQFFTLGIDSVM